MEQRKKNTNESNSIARGISPSINYLCLFVTSSNIYVAHITWKKNTNLSIVYSNLHISRKMEVLSSLILVSSALIFLIFAWKVLNWVWITPKKMEKILREKGFKGNSYRLLIGDLKDTANMIKEAKSKPMNFNHDIIPRVMPFINNLVHDYGKKSFIWMGPTATMLIFESDQIREILAKSYVYRKPPSNPFAKLLAGGLASYDKDKWAKHRRLINPAFNLEKLKLMLPAFHLSCSDMMSKWDMMASTEQGSFELDVWPYLQTLTSDAISRTAFGSNYEEGKKIFELQRELIEHILQLLNTVYIPGMLYLPTKRIRRMKAISKEVQTSILNIINKRMKAIQENGSSGDDLLGVLLESNLKEINEQGSKKSGMNLEEVIEECKLFYFAGQETTATLLVWTLILLAKHSDWQDRARDEIRLIFGENKPDYEGLNHLKVMNMIFYEVLRLYPPAVMLGRMIYEDTTLGDQTLPAGMQLLLPAILLHHDEKIWGADAKEFNPERFSEGVAKATKGQHVYFPFSSGPRVCIGQTFAMLEAKMALSMILQIFSFEISPLYAHAPFTVITLQPQHGAQLVLHKL